MMSLDDDLFEELGYLYERDESFASKGLSREMFVAKLRESFDNDRAALNEFFLGQKSKINCQ